MDAEEYIRTKKTFQTTWAEFKAEVERLGVKDDDVLDAIDIQFSAFLGIHCEPTDRGWLIT